MPCPAGLSVYSDKHVTCYRNATPRIAHEVFDVVTKYVIPPTDTLYVTIANGVCLKRNAFNKLLPWEYYAVLTLLDTNRGAVAWRAGEFYEFDHYAELKLSRWTTAAAIVREPAYTIIAAAKSYVY